MVENGGWVDNDNVAAPKDNTRHQALFLMRLSERGAGTTR
jgi:hypothetical protein